MIAFMNDAEFESRVQPLPSRRSATATAAGYISAGTLMAGRPSRPTIKAVAKPDFTPFIVSLLIPGLGHIITGRFLAGILFLIIAVFVWWPPIVSIWPVFLGIHLPAALFAMWR